MSTQALIGFAILVLTSSPVFALSPEALEGEKLYPACHICHDPNLDPPLGPPMWGVQRQYQRNTLDNEDFIESMVAFVKHPTREKALMNEPVIRFGVMPALPLPDDMLTKIAHYILEQDFSPPCEHWQIAIKRAKQTGDIEHARKDAMQLERFCN